MSNLTDKEKQALALIEADLASSDPKLAKTLRGARPSRKAPKPHPNTIVPAPALGGRWAQTMVKLEQRWERRLQERRGY